ncbi:hypothetical protein [Nautilia sp.]
MIEVADVKEVLASILSNPDYVSDEVIQKAIEDTKEIVKDRMLETPFVLDIAIYRVFMRVNLEVPENVEKAYKEAIKRLKDVPINSNDGSFSVIVSKRNGIWI